MSVTKLLKESEKWLKQAEKSVVIKKAPKDAGAPFKEFVEKRKAEIEARIAALKEQQAAAIKRYDQAIADQEAELKRLHEQIRAPEGPHNDG